MIRFELMVNNEEIKRIGPNAATGLEVPAVRFDRTTSGL